MISPELLRRYQCFAGVSSETLKAVALIADEAEVPAGTQIHCEGEPAEILSIIVYGRVDVEYTLATGERRIVDTLEPGDILGWPAMVEPYKITCFATARTATHLIKVEAQRLRELCERDTFLGYRIMGQIFKLLSERLEAARVQLATAS
jgi:CRP-like cAMP-binding protein